VKRWLILLVLCGVAPAQTQNLTVSVTGTGTVTGSGQTYQNINLYPASTWLLCTYTTPPPTFCAGGTGIPSPAATVPTTGISSPSLSGSAMLSTLSGPNSTNTGWYQNFGASDNNTTFVLNEYIYIPTASLALMNDFERDQFQYLHSGSSGLTVNSRYYWGTHCVLSSHWFVWNSYTAAWVDTGAACSGVTANTWHHLTITVHRVAGDTSGSGGYGKMYYDSIYWDGTNVCGGSCPTTSAGALPSGYAEQTGIMLQTDILTAGTVNVYDDEINETQSGAPGISCPGNCTAAFNTGSSVSLGALPATGYVFNGWTGGGCTGTGPCSVTMSTTQTASAQFAPGTVCGPPTYNCTTKSTATVQTPNTPPITSPGSTGMTCVPGTANGGGTILGCANSWGYDTSLNPAGLNPITRMTDNTMISGYPASPTPSQGDNDLASNCALRGITPGSTFTTTACAIYNTYYIVLTYGACPYVEGWQVTSTNPVHVTLVNPLPATKGAGFTVAACGNFSWSHTNPQVTYNVPGSGTPIIYQTAWTPSGGVGSVMSYNQTPLYNLQTLCPLPSGFSTTWASSTSTDITDTYFTIGLSNVGGQNTGAYMVFLDTSSATPTCTVYVTGGTTAAAGTESCMGANCPSSSQLAAFSPGCLFTIHDVFMLQNPAGTNIPLSTGGYTSGHSCITNKPVWQPYGGSAGPQLLQASIKGTVGGDIFTGGHYSTGYYNIGVINNPYFFSVPAAGVTAVSTTTTTAISIGTNTNVVTASEANIFPTQSLTFDTGSNQETVTVLGVSGGFISAVFTKAHASGVAVTNTLTPVITFSDNCENHISQQNANLAETNPMIGSSSNNNYSTSGSGSTWPSVNGWGFNEVYAVGGNLGPVAARFNHNFILGPGSDCAGTVGPFDNTNTDFFAAYGIGDVTQDGAIFWWSSSFLGQLGTDAAGNYYAAIFAVGLDMGGNSSSGGGGTPPGTPGPTAPCPWFFTWFWREISTHPVGMA
jgi:uncharacterized repeat protein (TIGR02543 family)